MDFVFLALAGAFWLAIAALASGCERLQKTAGQP